MIIVANVNDAPTVASPILDQPATQGIAFSYAFPVGTFADSDVGNVFTYTASGLPAWLTFNAATRTFSGTPGNAQVGFVDITVTATDNGTLVVGVSDTFRITVANVNDAPTIAFTIPDRAATQGVAFSYAFPVGTFADIDAGNVFTYTASVLPAWLTFNESTRTFSGTPGNANVGFVDITVTLQENAFPYTIVSDTFRITVADANDAPTVVTPIPDQAATQDVPFTYLLQILTFSDLDADNVFTYTASDLPAWLTFNAATRTFSGTLGDANVGFVDITLTATDNGTPSTASINDAFRMTVVGVNDVPIFTKGANQSLPGGTNTLQTVAAWATGISDGDSHAVQALTFEVVSNSNPGLFSVAPAIASDGALTYASNGSGGTATIGVSLLDDATAGGAALTLAVQTFTISLTDNTGPVGGSMTLAPGSIVDAGVTLTVTFAAWSDSSSPLSYAVLVNDGVVSASGPSASRTTTAPVTPGTYTLKGRILDSLGNSTETSQSFTVLSASESWRKLHFGSPDNNGDGADHFDFDNDSVVNRVEFAFNMNPKTADSGLLPRPVLDGNNLTLSYPVLPGVNGIRYGAQWSETLAPDGWHPIPDSGTPQQPVFTIPTTNRARLLMRHAITAE